MIPDDTPRDAHRYLRRWEASEYLRNRWGMYRAPGTLAKLASVGGGPRFAKMGKWPLYSPDDLDAWVQGQIGPTVSSTSELKMMGAA
ncbi:MAG: hypothetical protein INF50_09495 [Rhodobacter sp.]|nr:hypothetical protein [Rhodobacter sp.]